MTWKRLLASVMVLILVAAACGTEDDAVESNGEEIAGDVADNGSAADDTDDGTAEAVDDADDDGTAEAVDDADDEAAGSVVDVADDDAAGSAVDVADDEAADDTDDHIATKTADDSTDDATEGTADDEGSANGAANDDGSVNALLGEPNPATGDPVKVGFVSDGQSAAIDNSAEIPAAQAAADYANGYLRGAAGRTIELVTCETKQTPAGAQDCVAELVSEGVVAVLNGASGQGGTLSSELNEIGIPFFTLSVNDEASIAASLTFILINSLAVFVTPAAVAADAGLTKVAVVTIDVPAATDALNVMVPLFYPNAGVEGTVVAVPPGTPDMTPQIQTAISSGAELFGIIGDETFCISAFQALELLGFGGPVVTIGPCIGEESVSIVDLEGMIVSGPTSDDPADAERALFLAVMEEFAPDVSSLTVAERGFMPVIAFARAMSAHPDGGMTPDTVVSALMAMAPAQIPLAPDGAMFQCNRTAVVIAPAFCAAGTLITTLDADGNSTGYAPVDLSGILRLG